MVWARLLVVFAFAVMLFAAPRLACAQSLNLTDSIGNATSGGTTDFPNSLTINYSTYGYQDINVLAEVNGDPTDLIEEFQEL